MDFWKTKDSRNRPDLGGVGDPTFPTISWVCIAEVMFRGRWTDEFNEVKDNSPIMPVLSIL